MIKTAGNMTSAGGAATKSAGSAMNNTAGNMISVRKLVFSASSKAFNPEGYAFHTL